jgi:hypothetical protein
MVVPDNFQFQEQAFARDAWVGINAATGVIERYSEKTVHRKNPAIY